MCIYFFYCVRCLVISKTIFKQKQSIIIHWKSCRLQSKELETLWVTCKLTTNLNLKIGMRLLGTHYCRIIFCSAVQPRAPHANVSSLFYYLVRIEQSRPTSHTAKRQSVSKSLFNRSNIPLRGTSKWPFYRETALRETQYCQRCIVHTWKQTWYSTYACYICFANFVESRHLVRPIRGRCFETSPLTVTAVNAPQPCQWMSLKYHDGFFNASCYSFTLVFWNRCFCPLRLWPQKVCCYRRGWWER